MWDTGPTAVFGRHTGNQRIRNSFLGIVFLHKICYNDKNDYCMEDRYEIHS